METPNEIWQVDVDGAIYEADTETLKHWIADGHVTPETKVQKGTLKWIELRRVPTFRGLFDTASAASQPAPSWPAAEPSASYDFAPVTPAADPYASAGPSYAPAPAGMCINHPVAPAKFICLSCGAALCNPCVKKYGNAAVCTLCGQLCKPFNEATTQLKKQMELSEGFGMKDFLLAVQYPLKDPIALVIVGCLYGVLCLFGIYGQLAATGLLFGYVSHAIRRVSMGNYEEGPSPDLSDPADLIFEAGKLAIAVFLVTAGPFIAAILFTAGSVFDAAEPGEAILALGFGAVLVMLAALWFIFYYPMALLVAGYTGGFLATLNPIMGLATMVRLGFDYAKAYGMYVIVLVGYWIVYATLGVIGPAFKMGGTIVEAIGYLVQYMLQGALYFFASMVIAAVLGLLLYKRQDVVGVDD